MNENREDSSGHFRGLYLIIILDLHSRGAVANGLPHSNLK